MGQPAWLHQSSSESTDGGTAPGRAFPVLCVSPRCRRNPLCKNRDVVSLRFGLRSLVSRLLGVQLSECNGAVLLSLAREVWAHQYRENQTSGGRIRVRCVPRAGGVDRPESRDPVRRRRPLHRRPGGPDGIPSTGLVLLPDRRQFLHRPLPTDGPPDLNVAEPVYVNRSISPPQPRGDNPHPRPDRIPTSPHPPRNTSPWPRKWLILVLPGPPLGLGHGSRYVGGRKRSGGEEKYIWNTTGHGGPVTVDQAGDRESCHVMA